jgi:hypothetical protein
MFHNLQREILLDHIILVCYTPTRREGAILQSPCPSVRSHFRNRYLSFYWKKLFYIWFALAWWLVPCLPFPGLLHIYFLFTVWLKFFMFAVMKIFITDISASTGRNDFIFDIWLWHGDLYRVSPFQVYRTYTSCLQSDLEFFIFAVIKTFVTDISASTGRNDFIPPLIERGLYCNHLVRPSIRSHFRYRFLSFYWKKWFYIWYMALAWWLVPCLPFPGLLHIYFLFTVWLRIFHVCRLRVGVCLARQRVQPLVVPDFTLHVFWNFTLSVL